LERAKEKQQREREQFAALMGALGSCQEIAKACEEGIKNTTLPLGERVCLEVASSEAGKVFNQLCVECACVSGENFKNSSMFTPHTPGTGGDASAAEQMDKKIKELQAKHAIREGEWLAKITELEHENERLQRQNAKLAKENEAKSDVISNLTKPVQREMLSFTTPMVQSHVPADKSITSPSPEPRRTLADIRRKREELLSGLSSDQERESDKPK
jgi:malonyl CoA-acyl carrier protein transacylase